MDMHVFDMLAGATSYLCLSRHVEVTRMRNLALLGYNG